MTTLCKKIINLFSFDDDRKKVYIFLLIFIAVLIFFGRIISPGFMKFNHLGVLLRQTSFALIAAIGQTFVILTGGIDISIGPIISLGNIFVCELLARYGNLTIPIALFVLALGTSFGFFNGLGIVYFRIPPIIMTLATGSIVSGITLVLCRGSAAGYASPLLQYLGSKIIFSFLPIPFLISLIILGISMFILNRTLFGRKVYAIGANEITAFASGVDINRTKIIIYCFSGFTASLTGILLAGYTQTGFLGIGSEYTMSSIAAVVIGGTSIVGGEGSFIGTFLGVFILILSKSILTVLRMPEAGRYMMEGIIILALIIFYTVRKHD